MINCFWERKEGGSAAEGREEADEKGNSNMMSTEDESERLPKRRHISDK